MKQLTLFYALRELQALLRVRMYKGQILYLLLSKKCPYKGQTRCEGLEYVRNFGTCVDGPTNVYHG